MELALPIRDTELFKHTASPHILNFLFDNPEIHLPARQLANVTPMSERATLEAINTLEANDLVETFREGNARHVRINRARLHKPDDPISSVPQLEFRTPLRIARQYIEDELEEVLGIILFGSVSRGEADRKSDIDLWVLVRGDHMKRRHQANKLANHLEQLQIPASIEISSADSADLDSDWEAIKNQLENPSRLPPSAERYSFELIVETPQSVLNQPDRIDAEDLFGDAITLCSSETLQRVKQELLTNE
ncbi:nucleotidyltransferase domain-containing protein [Natronoarchaeum sp. GCM10025703]|uniref:nucleotidyltransferase domain-containing protein n=1 Tax=unclassified Natronoarchaeum TaxID=2620183 RepID=UPI003620115B